MYWKDLGTWNTLTEEKDSEAVMTLVGVSSNTLSISFTFSKKLSTLLGSFEDR